MRINGNKVANFKHWREWIWNNLTRFEVLWAVKLKIHVFLDVTLYRSINSSRLSMDHINGQALIFQKAKFFWNNLGWWRMCDEHFSLYRWQLWLSYTLLLHLSSVTDKTTQPGATDRSTVLTQVFKNPHCALCNGVPPLNTTCWVRPLVGIIAMHAAFLPPLSIVMDFVAWEDKNQQHRWEYINQTNDADQKHRQFWWFNFLKLSNLFSIV
jgi:hypothetical protein